MISRCFTNVSFYTCTEKMSFVNHKMLALDGVDWEPADLDKTSLGGCFKRKLS